MKDQTYIAVVEKAVLASESPNQHIGFILQVKDKKEKLKWIALQSLFGTYPEEFNMFKGHLCKITGKLDGLVFKAKNIESIDIPDISWSV